VRWEGLRGEKKLQSPFVEYDTGRKSELRTKMYERSGDDSNGITALKKKPREGGIFETWV